MRDYKHMENVIRPGGKQETKSIVFLKVIIHFISRDVCCLSLSLSVLENNGESGVQIGKTHKGKKNNPRI